MEEKLNVDWETFEEKFNISRDDVIRVPNIFRCICKLYILKNHVTMFHENLLDNENLMCYSFQLGNKWIRNKIDMDTFRNIMNRIN